jgi:hypothetical protein
MSLFFVKFFDCWTAVRRKENPRSAAQLAAAPEMTIILDEANILML